MKNTDKEYRSLVEDIELNDRHVSGYAVVFETPSKNIGWVETIKRGAITQETLDKSDILAKFDHDDSKVLARSKYGKGSLTLTLDERGLKYEFDAPNTVLGDELLEYLKRGDITASSFCFTVANEDNAERWFKEGENICRHINKIDRLFDVSPVFMPAYEATTCAKRFEEFKAQSDEIDNYIENLKSEIDLI